MKLKLAQLATSALVLTAADTVYGQYAPPPPPIPFPGFLNEYLRKNDPYMNTWDFSGTLRMRYEIKENGLGLPPAQDFRKVTIAGAANRNDNSYFSDKVLAQIGYTAQWWNFLVQGRSSSTSGDHRTPQFEADGPVDLHQAFVTIGNHKEFPVSLKVGRQELSYGDERLVGAFAWNNIGRVFDTAKLRWQTPWFAAEAFTGKMVLPDDRNFNVWNDYNVFSGLYVTTKEIPKTLTDIYFFARNDGVGSAAANPGAFAPFQVAAPVARDIYTVGTRIRSATNELGNFDYTVEGAYQFGNWKAAANGARLDHRAFAVAANVGYTFADTFGTPRLALEYAFGSGDSNSADGKHETFDQLYPTGHKFEGYMDFASWQNVHDIRSIFQIKPHPQVSLAVEGHLFWLADTADNFYNKGGVARGAGATAGTGFGRNPTYSPFVGSEIDVVAGYAATKYLSFEGGYGHFFAGSYINSTWRNAGGAADADWVYIQSVFKF